MPDSVPIKWLKNVAKFIIFLIVIPFAMLAVLWDWLRDWFRSASTFNKWLAGITAANLMLLGVEWFIAKAGDPQLAHDLSEPTNNLLWCIFFVVVIIVVWYMTQDDTAANLRSAKHPPWWAVVLGVGIFVFFRLIPSGLVFLATNGSGSAFTYVWLGKEAGGVSTFANILVLLVPVLLIAFPATLYNRPRWREAPSLAKEVVLGWFAITASFVTGLYIILLHFARGPLDAIPLGQLSVAVLFAVLILVPVYRRLAGLFSTRGIIGVCDPGLFWLRQKQAAKVLLKAVNTKSSTNTLNARTTAAVLAQSDDEHVVAGEDSSG
jgi:hypothetical protein